MKELFSIAVGGALGATSRYLVSYGLYMCLGKAFPYGTLTVNVVGSFFMGVLSILILDKLTPYNPQLAGFLLVGFLGAFTTFSTFSMDTFRLFFDGQAVLGFFNIFLHLFACLGATVLGYYIAMRVFQ